MNPRLFCQEPGYPRAIALTYSFDPLFFERIPLRDLWYGGTSDITVVGDAGELQDAVSRYAGQFNFLGKKYLLTTAEVQGAFHPKLLLRVGPKGARLLLGSGNLTFCGWGGNKELGCNLTLDATDPDSSEIVNNVLDHIAPYLTSGAARDALARLRDYPWLINRDANVRHSILMTRPNESLASQLSTRWEGRRFDRLTVFTGSTDERGGFIDWCQKQLGVKDCVVSVSPENASFLQKEINKLNAKVMLAPFKGSQRLHAKFYWFEGPDGPAAVVGSANCSTAAWLLTPQTNGNVESVQIYDNPVAEDFADILMLFPEEREAVTRTESAKKDETEQADVCPYQMSSVVLQRSMGVVDVQFNQSPPQAALVTLTGAGGLSITLSSKEGTIWWGNVDETDSWSEDVSLVRATIRVDEEFHQTPLHWVDDLDAINRSSQSKQIMSSFGGLTRSKTSSEHEKVISDLALVSSTLFTESTSFNDPQLRSRTKHDDAPGPQAEPVKPEDLIKSLNELDIKVSGAQQSLGPGMHLSMFGVMRALFEEAETANDDDGVGDEAVVSGDDPDDAGNEPQEKVPPKTTLPQREPPPERYKQRLREQLQTFFEKFASDEFAEECTATKLVQAAAYPLAVALLGERGQWLSHDEARVYVTRTVDILLNRQRSSNSVRGLLHEVGERYKAKDQYEIYLQVVGDGTLWIALLTTLSQLVWEEGFERFERAINLYKVYGCDVLRSDTSVGKLSALVTRIQVEKAKDLIANEAPEVAQAIDSIERVLGEHYESLKAKSNSHDAGDLIWHPNAGWGIVKEPSAGTSMEAYLHLRGAQVKVATSKFYVNLKTATAEFPVLKDSLNGLLGVGVP